MSDPRSSRQRPNLRVNVRSATGSPPKSPRNYPASAPRTSTFPLSGSTPFARTGYSPFRSAGLRPPRPFDRDMSPRGQRKYHRTGCAPTWAKFKRMFSARLLVCLLMCFILMHRYLNSDLYNVDRLQLSASGFAKDHLPGKHLAKYQFYPASNPKISYTGRWTATPNRLRKDGTFPGVYLDMVVTNTTTLLLALHNNLNASNQTNETTAVDVPNPAHFSFKPVSVNDKPAPPISLLARVDDEEYILLPNASSLATISLNRLDPAREHHVRVVAPMMDDKGRGVLELEGLWLSKGGKLLKVPGTLLSEDYLDEDLFNAENDLVGEKHASGLQKINELRNNDSDGAEDDMDLQEEISAAIRSRRKVLEVVTDSPGSITRKGDDTRSGGADGLMCGVMGWEYLLGEMFSSRHVGIGADGMCLTQDCIGGTGFPAGLGDVFFRSGPYGSEYFEHSWDFSAYVPDVVILNLGGADHISFDQRQPEYNVSFFDLSARFETTYFSLVKGIRRLAYPKHPTILHSERLGAPGLVPSNTPALIPIFIMRPLRGQLEQSTQNVVARLRADGDKSVFWLDTSGWLDEDPDAGDWFFDERSTGPSKWRLTEQGNQRVAIFLHTHVCRYLASTEERCAFLPQEVYQGKVFDAEEANFNRYLENEKERRLREIFWQDQGVKSGEKGLPDAEPLEPSLANVISTPPDEVKWEAPSSVEVSTVEAVAMTATPLPTETGTVMDATSAAELPEESIV